MSHYITLTFSNFYTAVPEISLYIIYSINFFKFAKLLSNETYAFVMILEYELYCIGSNFHFDPVIDFFVS